MGAGRGQATSGAPPPPPPPPLNNISQFSALVKDTHMTRRNGGNPTPWIRERFRLRFRFTSFIHGKDPAAASFTYISYASPSLPSCVSVAMGINQSLLCVKSHFFLYWGFMASAPPYVMVVARQMGVPLAVQGVVSAVVTAAAVLSRPLIAALADTFPKRRKIIFLTFICLMLASYNPLGFLPPLYPTQRFSGLLIPPSDPYFTGLDKPSLVTRQDHDHSPDECVVMSAWDCAITFYSQEWESHIPYPDDITVSIRLISEGLNMKQLRKEITDNPHLFPEGTSGLTEGPSSLMEDHSSLTKDSRSLGVGSDSIKKGENSLEGSKSRLEEDQDGFTEDYEIAWHEVTEAKEGAQSMNRSWEFNDNKTMVYEVDGLPESIIINGNNVSMLCLGNELGTIGTVEGAAQNRSCGPAILRQVSFWVYVVCLMVSYISATTVESISDAICCDTIGEGGDYGRQRMWGVLSYGLMGATSGILVDRTSGGSTVRDYRPAFFLMTACGVLDLTLSAACLKVPRLEQRQKGVWTNLRPLLRHVHFLIFLVTVFLTGFFDGLDTGFVFVLQEDIAKRTSYDINHVNSAQGLTLLVQALAAIPFMFLGHRFIKRFGARKVINAVLCLYSARLLLLATASFSENLWATVAVEVINGPCFGLGYTAIVVHASHLAPRGFSTTVQSVVGVCYGTLGYAGASFVGCVVYELVGGRYLYLLTGSLALFTWALHLIYCCVCPQEDSKATKIEGADAGKQEDPEVQVVIKAAGDTIDPAQDEGGTAGEPLKKKDHLKEREKKEEEKSYSFLKDEKACEESVAGEKEKLKRVGTDN